MAENGLFFDYYSATSLVPAPKLHEGLLAHLDLATAMPCNPKNGYSHAFEYQRGDSCLGRLMWGGDSTGGTSFLSASGRHAQPLADYLRRSFPTAHRITRLDVAADYDEPDAFDRLVRIGLSLASSRNLRTSQVGDWLGPSPGTYGRTLYLGSRSSVAMVRIYEKGKQLGAPASPHWVRVELEAKPKRAAARETLATASHAECWGVTSWTRELQVLLGRAPIQRIPAGTIRRPEDQDRAWASLIRQYGRTIQRQAAIEGGYLHLAKVLQETLGLAEADDA